MRDAVKLAGNTVKIRGVKYKLDSFHYVETFNDVYVKLISKNNDYLNMKLDDFAKELIDGREKINS